MRVLVSVSDKRDLIPFAEGLVAIGAELVSTGGTMSALRDAGLPVTAVSEVTGFPEILDGRVKTLHPAIHAGLLARRDVAEHREQLARHGFSPFDVVVINLYPFASTIQRGETTLKDAVEQIDIGGPAMIRAAAKNFADIIVVVDPEQYQETLTALKTNAVDDELRRRYAAQAFAHVAAYDTLIASYLRGDDALTTFPPEWSVAATRHDMLRYGENPHQQAAAYQRWSPDATVKGVLDARQLGGKELSFNNLLDADAAWTAIGAFNEPAVAIIKHTISCGLAVRPVLVDAFTEALAGDPISAFGGIVALNRPVDVTTATNMMETFFEVVVAPGFAPEAIDILGNRRGLRLLEMPEGAHATRSRDFDIRPIVGGLLIQEPDGFVDDPTTWRVVTDRQPSEPERRDLAFAWEVARHVKSNAIVFAKNQAIVGVGSGQPNRLESVSIAAKRAGDRASGAVMASDAFFPFADGMEAALSAGVTAIIQPGGSVRDHEVIAAANAAEATMIFTGTRHFRH